MRRSLPSMTGLLCFEAAARTGSFTLASQEVFLSQSAVSRQIGLLEEFVGQPLFARVRQRVELTPAGRRFLLEVSPILEKLESMILRMQTFDHMSGVLTIGVYPTLGRRWLLPKLLKFNKEYPEITVNYMTYLNNAEFNHEQVDIGIVQGEPPWTGCRADELMPESLVAVASPTLMTTPLEYAGDLFKYRILQHVTRPLSWKIWFNSLGQPLPALPKGPIFSQFEMLIEATIAGHGISILPLVLVQQELDEGRLVQAHTHIAKPPFGYYLLTPEFKADTPKIELLRNWMLANCSEF